jgi:hypothetical protein
LKMSLKAAILDLLDKHNVRESVSEVLLWEKPRRSAALFLGGVATFVLVHVAGIGMLTVIGTLAILQLFIYRTAEALQNKDLIRRDIDLKEVIVLTPDASTISTSIEIIGDALRTIEESIKEVSLTADYIKLMSGIGTLIFLSALGRVVSLPVLLVMTHIGAFTIPWFYTRNQEKIDQVITNALEATELFLEKNFQAKIKLQ